MKVVWGVGVGWAVLVSGVWEGVCSAVDDEVLGAASVEVDDEVVGAASDEEGGGA